MQPFSLKPALLSKLNITVIDKSCSWEIGDVGRGVRFIDYSAVYSAVAA